MTSITAEPPTLRSIPSIHVASSSTAGAAPDLRSYSCYNCNYSFHITPIADTSSTYSSSFRCPRCHQRHLIPHHTIYPRELSLTLVPTRNHDHPPIDVPPALAVSNSDSQTSDYSDSDGDYDSDNSVLSLAVPDFHPSTPALKSFVDLLPVKEFPPNSTEAQSCSICMDDFEAKSDASGTVNELPCKHYFHRDCIVEWLERSNTCPLCRHKLPGDRSEEEGIDHEANAFEVGYNLLVDLARGSALLRASGGGSINSNAIVPNSDRRDGGELSGRELDAMRDEDGDTLMTDA